MRLKTLSITDFRGFTGQHQFNLDADAIVLIAANGQGKTSFFDSVLWGLTGHIPRLGEEPEIVSLYAEGSQATVDIVLGGLDGRELHIRRREPGGLSVSYGSEEQEGDVASALLHRVLWPEAERAPDSASAFAGALTRSVYLQQDLVKDFVQSGDSRARFSAVSELCGAGRVTELATQLENSRLSWSRTTNARSEELEEARRRLESHQSQLDSLSTFDSETADVDDANWSAWWTTAIVLAPSLEGVRVARPEEQDAANALDEALRILESGRRSIERQLSSAEGLLKEFESDVSEPKAQVDLQELQGKVASITASAEEARESLVVAEKSAADMRRQQTEARETAKELGALARLALRHIDGVCPVCEQTHDEGKTKIHLEALMAAVDESTVADDAQQKVSNLADELERFESELASAQAEMRAAEILQREGALRASERNARIHELGAALGEEDLEPTGPKLSALVDELRSRRDRLDGVEAEGERLSVGLARTGEQARRRELESTLVSERSELDQLERLVQAREETGELASQILDALREASASVVEEELERIDPLLQFIYGTADPHPSLRHVRLISRVSRGRGSLSPSLDDRVATISVNRPEAVLSSSQLNALAVSVFLAMNVGLPAVPLPLAMLDDPLQSLDDINLLGLVDLLRRFKGQRQLLLSTHDERFGGLLKRKLRPVGDSGATRLIEIHGWQRNGPTTREEDVERDPELLRIAA